MKGSVLTAAALVGGGVLAHFLLDDPGYVAISAGRSCSRPRCRCSPCCWCWLYFLTRAILGSLNARHRLAALRAERRRRRARDDTQRGLLDLAAGRWRKRGGTAHARRPRSRLSRRELRRRRKSRRPAGCGRTARRMAGACPGSGARRARSGARDACRDADASRPGRRGTADARAAGRLGRPQFARPGTDGALVPEAWPRRPAARRSVRGCAAPRNLPESQVNETACAGAARGSRALLATARTSPR